MSEDTPGPSRSHDCVEACPRYASQQYSRPGEWNASQGAVVGMNLTLNAGSGLVAFVFDHGPLFATVVNERDRDLAPRKQISMGEQFEFGPIGLVTHGTAPHRLAIYDAPKGGRMLFSAKIEPLEPNDQLAVSLG